MKEIIFTNNINLHSCIILNSFKLIYEFNIFVSAYKNTTPMQYFLVKKLFETFNYII